MIGMMRDFRSLGTEFKFIFPVRYLIVFYLWVFEGF